MDDEIGLEGVLGRSAPQNTPYINVIAQKFQKAKNKYISLGDKLCAFSDSFTMYLVTRLPNPRFVPEDQARTNMVDFTVTRDGLEEQLLGMAVQRERPDVEEKSVKLLLQMAADNKQLASLEALILRMLSESKGNILDDKELIDTLAESKVR